MRKLRSIVAIPMMAIAISTIAQTGYEANFKKCALTPPMGWNSWDCYGPTVVESEVKANADYMAEHLKDYGWEYVVVDIRWFVENDKAGGYNQTNPIYVIDQYGRYTPALNRFPSAADGAGFKPLADYCHERGLKFGIHLMRGLPKKAALQKLPVLGTDGITCDMICNNDSACTWLADNYKVDYSKPGAQQYYNSCFDMYAEWGVDYVKIDDLSRPYHTAEIEMIRHAIDQCGRPMVLSISPGETPIEKIDHVATHANMWRTVDDFWDNWSQLNYQFEICAKWAPYIAPGTWPDADMLPLGKISIRGERGDERWTNFTTDEQYTMMNLWTIFKSPLMYGGDLPQNDNATNALLTNKDVLYMHSYSTDNHQASNVNNKITWTAIDPANGDRFVAIFNAGGTEYVTTENVLWRSGTISYLTTGYCTTADVNLPEGATELALIVTDGGDGYDSDHADWINPTVTLADGTIIDLTEQGYVRGTCGWGEIHTNSNINGGRLSIDGKEYDKGFATHANSILLFDMPEGAVKFSALTGIDNTGSDQGSKSSVEFMVFAYDPTIRYEYTDTWVGGNVELKVDPSKQVVSSGYISSGLKRQYTTIEADITGAEILYLVVTNGDDNLSYDHADWANPTLIDADGNTMSLTDIKWEENPINGWYAPKLNRNNDGNTMTINGVAYDKGFGVNAPSMLTFVLPEGHKFVKFTSIVGHDDDVINAPFGATMEFRIYTQNPSPDESVNIPLDLDLIGMSGVDCEITDMWSGEKMGVFGGSDYAPLLNAHASALYRVHPLARSQSASVSASMIESDGKSVLEISVNSPNAESDAKQYVQVLCDGKIVGTLPLSESATSFLCSDITEGNHEMVVKYSGTPTVDCAVSSPIIVNVTGKVEAAVSAHPLSVRIVAGGVEIESPSDGKIRIYTMAGHLVKEVAVKVGSTFCSLPPGLYIVGDYKVKI